MAKTERELFIEFREMCFNKFFDKKRDSKYTLLVETKQTEGGHTFRIVKELNPVDFSVDK